MATLLPLSPITRLLPETVAGTRIISSATEKGLFEKDALKGVYYSYANARITESTLAFDITLVIRDEAVLGMPGFEQLALVLRGGGTAGISIFPVTLTI